MPGKAADLLDMLGVDKKKRRFEDARFGVDKMYGTAILPLGTGAWDALFPPLTIET
jgi:methionyl-tRNA synthetase